VLPREVPFLRIGLPLCAGIISGLYLKPGPAILSSIAGLTILGFCLSLFFNKYLVNILHGVSLNIALWLLGCFLCIIERENLSVLDNEQGKYLCTVTGFPEEKPNTYSIPLKIHGKILYNQQIKPLTGSILVYLRKDSVLYKYYPGEIMVIRLTPVPVTNRGNPDEFDYRLYMEEQDIKYYSMADEGDVSCIVRPKHIKLRYKALLIREKIVKMYYARGLQGDRLALVSAITLGQKNLLDSDVKQIFMKAGIMHIMAVSGLHAAILSLFIFRILFFLKGRMNNLRTIITLLLLWLFAFVTGLTPSVLRATIMYSFITAGNLLNRKPNNLNSVLASGFVLLLARPLVLFNTSFLLSYSAVLFIICFYKDLYSKLAFGNWFADKIWQSAAVSITAQAGTLPLTILLFNRFPTWFLLTNIIIVPIASLLIILACLIPVTYPLRFISTHLASLLGFLATVTQYLTEKASSLPFASLENIGMKPFQSFLLFMVIFF
jgi:competence protein ComEC